MGFSTPPTAISLCMAVCRVTSTRVVDPPKRGRLQEYMSSPYWRASGRKYLGITSNVLWMAARSLATSPRNKSSTRTDAGSPARCPLPVDTWRDLMDWGKFKLPGAVTSKLTSPPPFGLPDLTATSLATHIYSARKLPLNADVERWPKWTLFSPSLLLLTFPSFCPPFDFTDLYKTFEHGQRDARQSLDPRPCPCLLLCV